MPDLTIDASAFNDFERQGWQQSAAPYDRHFGSLTAQAGEALLDALDPSPAGKSLLDLATGPGYIALHAAQLGYSAVVGIDFSDEMVALAQQSARRSGSPVQFRLGDAEALQEKDASFDAVSMNFGMLHLGRPQLAMTEACRILKARGRFGFTVWSDPRRSAGFAIILKAIDAFADRTTPIPEGPPFFHFSDPARCTEALQSAGFTGIEIRTVDLAWKLESGEVLFDAFLQGTARTGGLLRAQSRATLEAIRRSVMEDAGQFLSTFGLRIPVSVVLATGTKAG